MNTLNRRHFLLGLAALPAACAVGDRERSAAAARDVRPPAVGQSWRFAKHDLFTKSLVDIQVDQVLLVGRTIDISSHDEGKPPRQTKRSAWGLDWLHPYADAGKPDAELPSEVQSSWGMILVDPHWNQVQVFKDPVPLWPTRLQPGWRAHINTRYKTVNDDSGLPWDQTMKAESWEMVTVPAGKFRALRYTNLINFRSPDPNRGDSVRRETVWFAPEIGRWVARESSGRFFIDDSAADQPYNENGYRWELLEFT